MIFVLSKERHILIVISKENLKSNGKIYIDAPETHTIFFIPSKSR